MTEGSGVWLGKVKCCLGRGSEHSWKRMECLGSTRIGGGLSLVGVFSEFCPPSFRLTQWKASASSHPYPGGCYWVLGGRTTVPMRVSALWSVFGETMTLHGQLTSAECVDPENSEQEGTF